MHEFDRGSRSAIAAAALATMLAAGCGAAAGDGPIHIAVAGPLEAANGRSMRLAAELAVEEINREGGVRGRPLEVIFADDQASPDRAIAIAGELARDRRVVAVIGHLNSAATIAAASVYNDPAHALLQISPASSAPAVSEAGDWTFRVYPSDLQHGPALARWALDALRGRRAAVVYANDAYGRGVLASFANAFEAAGGTIIARDPYLPALLDADDALDAYIERAIRNRADVLMLAGQAEEGVRALSAARRLGFTGPVLGADGMTGLRDAGPIAEGTYVSSAFLPDRPTPEARAFVERYQARFDELPDHRGAMTYDAIRLVARALAEVGTDRRTLRNRVAATGNGALAFEGVSGTIEFDANGDVASKEVAIGVVRDGRLVTAGS